MDSIIVFSPTPTSPTAHEVRLPLDSNLRLLPLLPLLASLALYYFFLPAAVAASDEASLLRRDASRTFMRSKGLPACSEPLLHCDGIAHWLHYPVTCSKKGKRV